MSPVLDALLCLIHSILYVISDPLLSIRTYLVPLLARLSSLVCLASLISHLFVLLVPPHSIVPVDCRSSMYMSLSVASLHSSEITLLRPFRGSPSRGIQ